MSQPGNFADLLTGGDIDSAPGLVDISDDWMPKTTQTQHNGHETPDSNVSTTVVPVGNAPPALAHLSPEISELVLAGEPKSSAEEEPQVHQLTGIFEGLGIAPNESRNVSSTAVHVDVDVDDTAPGSTTETLPSAAPDHTSDVDTDNDLGGLSEVDTELDSDEEQAIASSTSLVDLPAPTIAPPLPTTTTTTDRNELEDEAPNDKDQAAVDDTVMVHATEENAERVVSSNGDYVVQESSTSTTAEAQLDDGVCALIEQLPQQEGKQEASRDAPRNSPAPDIRIEPHSEDVHQLMESDSQIPTSAPPPSSTSSSTKLHQTLSLLLSSSSFPALSTYPPGLTRFAAAQELERRLSMHGATQHSDTVIDIDSRDDTGSSLGDAAYQRDVLFARLISQLEDAKPPEATPGSPSSLSPQRGANNPLQKSNLSSPREPLSALSSLYSSGGSAQVSLSSGAACRCFISPPLEPLFHGAHGRGSPSAVAKFFGIVAVGTITGSVHVLLPAAGKTKGPPRLCDLIDKSTGNNTATTPSTTTDSVTSLCLSQHSGCLLLAAGHASGTLRLWELKAHTTGSVAWTLVKTIQGMHAASITSVVLLEGTATGGASTISGGGGGTTWAMTADAHGRLVAHNVSRHLSLTAQALVGLARQLTGSSTPSPSILLALQAAGQDPGIICHMEVLRTTITPTNDQHQQQQHQDSAPQASQVYLPGLGHFVLLVATRAVMLCMMSQDGKLSVLHVFLPPRSASLGVLPYAAWHLHNTTTTTTSNQSSVELSSRGRGTYNCIAAVVAVAWGNSVSAYHAVLSNQPQHTSNTPLSSSVGSPKRESQDSVSHQSPLMNQPLPLPTVLGSWAVGGPVCGLKFFEKAPSPFTAAAPASPYPCPGQLLDTLAVVSIKGESETAVAVYQVGALFTGSDTGDKSSRSGLIAEMNAGAERLMINDWLIGNQAVLSGSSLYHAAFADWGEQLLLLSSRGMRVLHLMTWKQRLSALTASGDLGKALLVGVRLYLTGGPSSSSSSEMGQQQAVIGRWPADTIDPSQLSELSKQLLTVLCAYLDTHLGANESSISSSISNTAAESDFFRVAAIAVDTCLALHAEDALTSQIFPRFLAAGKLTVLMDVVEESVLRSELTALEPEVVHALVDHFVSANQPHRIERCILKLNVATLDLNQVIPLCIRHNMHSALVYIFTCALRDYQTPAALLLVAAAAAAGEAGLSCKEEAMYLGYKLLMYIQECLLGCSDSNNAATNGRREGGGGGGGLQFSSPLSLRTNQAEVRAHAMTFLLYSTASSIWECWKLWGELAHANQYNNQQQQICPAALLQDPYPALHFLCTLDAETTLSMLTQGLSGWDALESELAELSPEIAPLIVPGAGRTVTQAAVDAVCDMLQNRRFTEYCDSSEGLKKVKDRKESESESDSRSAALRFVAHHLASNRAVVPPGMLMQVLTHLTDTPPTTRDNTIDDLNNKNNNDINNQDGIYGVRDVREGIFKDVIAHAAAQMSKEERGQALVLARRVGFKQAEAKIRHSEHAYIEALQCLAEDVRHPEEAFQYIRDVLLDPLVLASDDQQRRQFVDSILALAANLVKLNARQTARLVSELLLDSQTQFLQTLASHPEDQFAYLKAAVDVQQEEDRKAAATTSISQNNQQQLSFTSNRQSFNTLPSSSSSSSSMRGLLSDMSVSSLYVKLLCQYQPQAVLPYLQSQDTYSVDDCLQHCLKYRVREGAAFLMERRGDVESALGVFLGTVDEANAVLVQRVKAKGVQEAGLLVSSGNTRSNRSMNVKNESQRSSSGGNSGGSYSVLRVESMEGSTCPELSAAREALKASLAMCIRFSQDHMTSQTSFLPDTTTNNNSSNSNEGTSKSRDKSKSTAEVESSEPSSAASSDSASPVQKVWLEVLQRYLDVLRVLRQDEHAAAASATAAVEIHGLKVLQSIFAGFVEEVIGNMASHVPLRSIAEIIMEKYKTDQFGDFKSTLLGLLGACTFELAILRCAQRVVAHDTIDMLGDSYRHCMRPAAVMYVASSFTGAQQEEAAEEDEGLYSNNGALATSCISDI